MDALKGQVALVTGAASGIGLAYCEELLKHGAKVALCDIDAEAGAAAAAELAARHGRHSVLFHRLDVTDYPQFEEAFVVTMDEFSRLDIVINNAGFMNDRLWELEVDVNVNGAIRGTLLALRFLGLDRGGRGGTVLYTAATAALRPLRAAPVYSATSCAIVGLTRAYGDAYHAARTGVRTLALCPGLTDTRLVTDIGKQLVSPDYELAWQRDTANTKPQSAEHVGRALIDVLSKGQSGSVWLVENGQPAREWRA